MPTSMMPAEPHDRLPAAYRLTSEQPRGSIAHVLPRNLFLEVTNRCNLRCTTCTRTYYQQEPSRDLTLEELCVITGLFPQLERAVLHGIGEPLLNPALPAMIAHLHNRGVQTLFNSNGAALTPVLGAALRESGLDEFRLSLDAAEPKLYARIRGRDLFTQVVANATAFAASLYAAGAECPRLSLWCMGMEENIAQLPDLLRLAARIGISEVYVQRLTFFVEPELRRGLARPEQSLYGALQAREAEIIAECEQLAVELGLTLRASGATDPRQSVTAAHEAAARPWGACHRPWTSAYITANGNVLPCCIAPFAASDYESLVMGNVWARDFATIWNGARYRAWRTAMASAAPPQACSGCGVQWSL